jgi:tetratricopeptide (TPR) repeat protein
MVRKRVPALTLLAVGLLAAASWVAAQQAPSPTPVPPTPTPTPVPPAAQQPLRSLMAWQPATARQTLEAKQATEGATPAFKAAFGYLRAQEGKFDEAFTNLNAAIAAAPTDPGPEFFKGEALYAQRKMNDAKPYWQRAHDKAKALATANPQDTRARYLQGAALVRLKKPEEARTVLTGLLDAGFDAPLVRFQLAFSYVMSKSWQMAKEQLDAVIAADQYYAYAYYYRGLALKEMKKTSEMTVDLDRFVRLAPNAPEADIARQLLGAAGGH